MKIQLLGAAGAGTATLGHALGAQLALPYFGTDAYFWLPIAQLFTLRWPATERHAQLAYAPATLREPALGV